MVTRSNEDSQEKRKAILRGLCACGVWSEEFGRIESGKVGRTMCN